jgi:hypothetical protein
VRSPPIHQVRHDRPACSRGTGRVLLRTIGGALVQPRPKLLEETCDVIATLPAACRTFDAKHIELAD